MRVKRDEIFSGNFRVETLVQQIYERFCDSGIFAEDNLALAQNFKRAKRNIL